MRTTLSFRHFLLALAVVLVWGSNFIVIELALAHLPPLLFATLRFAFAFAPAALMLARPPVPARTLAGFGIALGVGQFALMYLAMTRFISPGLASLVLQMQVFFTIGLAMLGLGARVTRHQAVALALAVSGIAVIAAHTDGATTLTGLALVLGAAFGWATSNFLAMRATPPDMLAFVVWSSVFAVPPLFALSLGFEGWPAIRGGLASAGLGTWAAVLFQGWGNTLFGYAAWNWLLARYPVATIAPLSLLVPVVAMGGSAWLLGEALPGWKLAAAALVLGGLALNVLWPRLRAAAPAARALSD